jgi:pyridoxine 5-phosphate synthase
MKGRIRLGVNVDHVATLRQQRGTVYPDPVFAASIAELAGADQITVHLREDRRHIQDRDLEILRKTVTTRLNLEMAAVDAMVHVAAATRPEMATLVPERREERTTEGGLDVQGHRASLERVIRRLQEADIEVSLFVDPDLEQIAASRAVGATIVELHTGDFCEARGESRNVELLRLQHAARAASEIGLVVAAGHGLDYTNVAPVAAIPEIEELNIGHSLISRAVFVGLDAAVREMIAAMVRGREEG